MRSFTAPVESSTRRALPRCPRSCTGSKREQLCPAGFQQCEGLGHGDVLLKVVYTSRIGAAISTGHVSSLLMSHTRPTMVLDLCSEA